ncbi:MAG: YbaB/EbfC family nucleoid-associated protein [Solirubrobacterales bacterium]|nr:YbaB/EbfC family nucleoid-associated protein [Solirubrobacterales bacterium]
MAQQPNLNQMMKQLQQAQTQMAEEQEKLKTEIVEASAGGGMVNVKITGDQQITEVTIDPQAVDPEDVEMLQDMVLAATNEAIRSSQALAEQRLGGIAGGLGLPGM